MPGVTDLASARDHVGTRTNQGSGINYITEKPDCQHQPGHALSTKFGLLTLVEAGLFKLTGWFQVHLCLVI